MSRTSDFQPNWVSTPGASISRVLKKKNITVDGFAGEMKMTTATAQRLLHGEVEISSEVAEKLESVVGSTTDFWMRREKQYREDLVRLTPAEEKSWLSSLPIKSMIEYKWIRKSKNNLKACLDFFAVSDVWTWNREYGSVIENAAFRTSQSYSSKLESIAAWIRQGEIQTERMECKPWNPEDFRDALLEIRKLTLKRRVKDFLPELIRLCSNCGVAVAVVRTPTSCPASGVTKFISSDRALLMLSFRYLTDDRFWFTFFHEAAHLLLHGEESLHLEVENGKREHSREESEANDFAANFLVPLDKRELLLVAEKSEWTIKEIAEEIGVSKGIIVGQMQHLGIIPYHHFNSLKRKFQWDDILPIVNDKN
jgi:Zn-dependent peptidase ImmA (M78 family)/plasmid maintenance system antidote protein VapI